MLNFFPIFTHCKQIDANMTFHWQLNAYFFGGGSGGGGGGGGGIENEIEKKTCPKNISQILICFNEM